MGFKDPIRAKEYKSWYYQNNKETLSAKQKVYNEANAEHIKERHLNRYKALVDTRPSYIIINGARKRAREQGVPFSIEEEDITLPEVCPILGIKLEKGKGKVHKASPTLDKIEPAKGYVKGNIQVISAKANVMKNDATPEELRMFAKWVLKTFPEEPDGQT